MLQINLHSIEHGSTAPLSAIPLAPANAICVFFRTPMGYRLLSPVVLFRRFLLCVLLPIVGWPLVSLMTGVVPLNEGRPLYYDFLLAQAALTLVRFILRMVGFNFGQEVHSDDAGYSIVARILPLPVALTEQLVVPGLLGWLGWTLIPHVSADLGIWLIICAASYLCLANYEARKRASERRAPVDDKVRANAFAANIDRHEEKVSNSRCKGKATPLYDADEVPDIARPGNR